MSDAILHKLQERVKELTALHRAARLLQAHDRPVADVLAEVVAQLPGAWQYPELGAARIRVGEAEHVTTGWRETPWVQRVEFVTRGGEAGSIEVAYLEERPPAAEGPFLAEERELIGSLAEMLRAHLEHRESDRALRDARDVLEAEVAARTADLRRLASRLTLAEERERRAIAADLHDHVGQALAFIKLRIREFQGNAIFGGFEDSLGETLRLLDQTIRYTRDLTAEISPPVLYELGLAPALDWLAEHFGDKRRFPVRFSHTGRAQPLAEDLAVMLFTSARELLLNSLKHSGAPGAALELAWARGEVAVTVTDRGRGFDPARAADPRGDAFGLFSIRERFRTLGGAVTIDAAAGQGCRITLRAPLAEVGP